MSFYTKHIFFCTNQKKDGGGCARFEPDSAIELTRDILKANNKWGEGHIRVSKAGCLGRCAEGPVCVIYPEGIWYNYFDIEDVRKIVEQSLLNDNIVSDLQI